MQKLSYPIAIYHIDRLGSLIAHDFEAHFDMFTETRTRKMPTVADTAAIALLFFNATLILCPTPYVWDHGRHDHGPDQWAEFL